MSSINALIWNAQCIHNKSDEFFAYLIDNNVHVALITETWLKTKHTLFHPKFKIYRFDRIRSRGGGVAIVVNKQIRHKLMPHSNLKVIESICVQIYAEQGTFDLIAVYYPGSRNTVQTTMFIEDIQNLTNRNRKFIIGGDLNAKHHFWMCHNSNIVGRALYSEMSANDFIVLHPNAPTHYPSTSRYPSTLDIVLTNDCERISEIKTLHQLGSDHLPITFQIGDVEINSFPSRSIRDYANANWGLFKNYLNESIDLSDQSFIRNLSNDTHIDIAIQSLTEQILTAQSIAIPLKILPTTNSEQLIIPQETLLLIRLRNIRRRQWQRTRNPNIKRLVNQLNKIIKDEIQDLRNQRFQHYVENCISPDDSRKKLWKLTKVLKKKNKVSPSLRSTSNDTIFITNDEKANELANMFGRIHAPTDTENSTVKQIVDATITEYEQTNRTIPTLSSREITKPAEIRSIIKLLKNSKSPGPDTINNRLVKHCPRKVIVFLTYIYNFCLKTAYFPKDWKVGKIIPIPKPGKDAAFIENYRPISLLNIFGKIFEKIILHRIQLHLESNDIVPAEQFGFRKHHSTTLQLFRLCESTKTNINDKKSTAMIFFDIEKAFDKVWHRALIYKLVINSFPYYIVKILISYLQNRQMYVEIQGKKSDTKAIHSGVPQGAVMSPTLFNIFTSDLKHSIPEGVEFALYADDTAIYSTSNDISQIMTQLQTAINNLCDYFTKWCIKVNKNKTQAIFFTRKTAPYNLPTSTSLNIEGNHILWQSTAKYLGVILDRRLTFKDHIADSTQKCNRIIRMMYSLINRNSNLNLYNKRLIYLLIIRSVLLYASPVWNDCAQSHKTKLKVLQNKCLKTIYNLPRRYPTSQLSELSGIPLIPEIMEKFYHQFKIHGYMANNSLISHYFENIM